MAGEERKEVEGVEERKTSVFTLQYTVIFLETASYSGLLSGGKILTEHELRFIALVKIPRQAWKKVKIFIA